MSIDENKLELIGRILKIDNLKALKRLEELFLRMEREEQSDRNNG